MNVQVSPAGTLTIGPPLSRPIDYLDLRAGMDLIVGVTACSAEMSNNYSFKCLNQNRLELETGNKDGF